MNVATGTLFLLITAFLLLLFGLAYATERGWIARRIAQHPVSHALSLGVYASTWTFYGAFDMYARSGLLFLSSYLGATAAFMLAPVVLIPIFNITERYKLSSLADLFAFRFRSTLVGSLTTVLLLCASLPLLSIQLQAVADSVHRLNSEFSSAQIAAVFCLLITLFAILFGARHPSMRARNRGLVLAMAATSLIKLVALLAIAIVLLWQVIGGPHALVQLLQQQPHLLSPPQDGQSSESWRTLLLAFFTATVAMPHMFHLAFTENRSRESLFKAIWIMPLYLWLMALCVPIISWAGITLAIPASSEELLHLGYHLNANWMIVLVFIGGLTAASGILIVAAISLAAMLQNHLVLPLLSAAGPLSFYSWLLWLRRLLIALVVALSYLFYQGFGSHQQMHLLGLSAFGAFLQFLPGIIATLFWTAASRQGFIWGLITGISTWIITTFVPVLQHPQGDIPDWQANAIAALLLNIAVFILLSRLNRPSEEESRAAEACLINTMDMAPRLERPSFQMRDIIHLLTPRLGAEAAQREAQRALQQLELDATRLGPLDLLRLRNTLEQNLSALIGPMEAATLLQPLRRPDQSGQYQPNDLHLLETHLETYQAQLGGMSTELDELRRFHRNTLEKLPIGACTVTPSQRILLWNQEMASLTGVSSPSAVDQPLAQLPAPWCGLLTDFIAEPPHISHVHLQLDHQPHWLTLHKSQLSDSPHSPIVILLEDETEQRLITDKLAHTERLASIGRFAAGVAHEIGNPVTGIACLAQNLPLETDNPQVLQAGEQIVGQTQRISRIVQSLIRFAHTGQTLNDLELQPVILQHCVQEAIQLVSMDRHSRQHHFHCQIPAEQVLPADPQLLLQVFINLLNNACDASPQGSTIEIKAHQDEKQVIISITDQGSGIPGHLQKQLFEPFFTTKSSSKGTGLGLSLVYNILREHCGSIEIISPANKKQNKGTQVIITLPGLQS